MPATRRRTRSQDSTGEDEAVAAQAAPASGAGNDLSKKTAETKDAAAEDAAGAADRSAPRPAKRARLEEGETEEAPAAGAPASTLAAAEAQARQVLDRAPSVLQESRQARQAAQVSAGGSDCPYLDTVCREALDFDFEKVCSVSLSNINVYACLVCGRYFQGRSPSSHAYQHALDAEHHVFMKLDDTMRIYCLPDGYEIRDAAFDDIRAVCNPRYSRETIAALDSPGSAKPVRALDGSHFLPGVLGLNEVNKTGYVSVVVQALANCSPLRDFFLDPANYTKLVDGSPAAQHAAVVRQFAALVRKLWNAANFKRHVSPHELLRAVSQASGGRFSPGKAADQMAFFTAFLDSLHRGLGGTRQPQSSFIHRLFQGRVRMTTLRRVDGRDTSEVREMPFIHLALDVPAKPLFKDQADKNVIAQVPLFQCLEKFDGKRETHTAAGDERRQFIITRLPHFLVMHVRRFARNSFNDEKNTTIVRFPLRLDMRSYVADAREETPTVYNLVANLRQERGDGEGAHEVHVQHKASGKLFNIQDLIVDEVQSIMVGQSEAYVLVYELAAKE